MANNDDRKLRLLHTVIVNLPNGFQGGQMKSLFTTFNLGKQSNRFDPRNNRGTVRY